MSKDNEEQELNELLTVPTIPVKGRHRGEAAPSSNECMEKCAPEPEQQIQRRLVQWTTHDKKVFVPSTYSTPKLEPGLYEIEHNNTIGIYFRRVGLGTEGLIRFKETNSDEVVKEIETFWERENLFSKFNLAFKRGILLWGPPGSGKCHQKGTPILMYDGTIKNVEDIKEGDFLMGDDSMPRKVLSLARGQEMMYKIDQMNGDPYVVNESHILSLKNRRWKKGRYNPHRIEEKFIDISVKDYLGKSNDFKHVWFGYKVAVEFEERNVPLDPYFLGLWLGDGTSIRADITTADSETVAFLCEYGKQFGLDVRKEKSTTSGKASVYAYTSHKIGKEARGANRIVTILRQLEVLGNKHIPLLYKINSRQKRLQLLAGLLDSDGYLGTNCFEFSNTNKQLISDVVYLARSLGFKCSVSQKKSYNKKTKFRGESQSIHISGHTNLIPTRIKRKQATVRKQIKDPLHTSIIITKQKVDDYYGFMLDGNGRFLLGDFTVTHNTCTIKLVIEDIIKRKGIVVKFGHPRFFVEGTRMLREIEPDTPCVVLMEDLDSILETYNESEVINILDGVDMINKVVYIATTNYPGKLGARIVNRPSRFDKRIKISKPNAESRKTYFEHLFSANGKELREKYNIEQWVEDTEDLSIAHLKELFVSLVILGRAYDESINRLKSMKDHLDEVHDGRSVGFLKTEN